MSDGTGLTVDEFVETKVLPELHPIVAAFRQLVRDEFPEVSEEMRGGTEKYHGVPSYRVKRIIAVISPTKKGVTFAFSRGASFEDRYGLLEGVGKTSKNVRLSRMGQLDTGAFRYYLRQAIDFDLS
jgi:hypothetical protein